MREPVKMKKEMYARLVAGEFGNTLARYFTITDWKASEEYRHGAPLWGVQHATIAGFPGTKLNVPTADVESRIAEYGFGDNYCITSMVPAYSVQWEGDVCRRWDGPGLLCSGNSNPAPGSWRQHMLKPHLWEGSGARMLLRSILNENSYDDIMLLLEEYPDHVVEFSALNRCFGTIPHRNAVVWEVRRY